MSENAVPGNHSEVLQLKVCFQRSHTEIDPAFRDNGARMKAFRDALEARLQEGCTVDAVLLRGTASPEGNATGNKALAKARSHALDSWFTDTLGLAAPVFFHREAVGEDWDGLSRIIRTLDVACIVSHPLPARTDTVYITRTHRDTVYVDVTSPMVVPAVEPESRSLHLDGRRMLFAIRTNALAIPLANVGIEVPLGGHWSVGADIYYPWIWHRDHAQGIDRTGYCNELMAADVEVRYWFPRKDRHPVQRLLGHSVGIYAAAGQYDFERDWSGHQGEFYNVGVDYLYACPIFDGRMHLEFELGVGYIYSPSKPYDCPVPGGRIYHRKGVTQYTRWFGPTRAQISLVVPIYVKRGGAR